MSSQEIERKFVLVQKLSDILHSVKIVGSYEIWQQYLFIEGDVEVRIRKKKPHVANGVTTSLTKFYFTVKSGHGVEREENEIEIPEPIYNMLKKTSKKVGSTIRKIRYVTEDGLEIDVYKDQLQSLITLEKEFASIEAANEFHLPVSLIGIDITHAKEFKNRSLAVNGLPKITQFELLARYIQQKITVNGLSLVQLESIKHMIPSIL